MVDLMVCVLRKLAVLSGAEEHEMTIWTGFETGGVFCLGGLVSQRSF